MKLTLVCGEVGLGTWLVWGVRDGATWWLALVTFSVFACWSAGRWLAGAESCGCFGAVALPPWITLAIDTLAIACLLRSRPTPGLAFEGGGWARLRVMLPAALLLCVALVAMTSVAQRKFSVLSSKGVTSAGVVVVEHEDWPGRRFPLLSHIESKADPHTGEWDVLLYHPDCHVCHDVMVQIERARQVNKQAAPVALISVTDPGQDPLIKSLRTGGCAVGALSGERTWFVTTPLRVRLSEGTCLEAGVIDTWE